MKILDKENMEQYILNTILFLMPFSIVFERKMYSNVLFPGILLLSLIKVKKQGMKKSFYEKYVLCFLSVILMSLIFTNYPLKSLVGKFTPYIKWLLFPTIIGQLSINARQQKVVFTSICITTVKMYQMGLLDIIKHFKIFTGKEISYLDIFKIENLKILEGFGSGFRLREIFPTLTETALVMGGSIFLFLFVLFGRETKKWVRILMIPMVLMGIFQFTLIQSRGANLSFILVLALVIFVKHKKKGIYILSAGLVGLGILCKILHKNPYVQRFKSISGGDVARNEIYTEAFKIFKDNPLTGIGFDNFMYATDYYAKASSYLHPHNMALKMLLELGILGFIIYYTMMFSILYHLWKFKERKINQIMMSIILLMLIYENFETVMFWKRASEYIWFMLAIAIANQYKKELKI